MFRMSEFETLRSPRDEPPHHLYEFSVARNLFPKPLVPAGVRDGLVESAVEFPFGLVPVLPPGGCRTIGESSEILQLPRKHERCSDSRRA